jgi:hypothetical protein
MRKLVVGGVTYLWRTTHRHRRAPDPRPCEDLFTAYLPDHPRAPLRVRFTWSHDGGPGYPGEAGVVVAGSGAVWNLNLPSTARALIEAGLARGWTPATAQRPFEIADGWALMPRAPA